MRRVLPDKRGVAGFGACGHQSGTLERPPSSSCPHASNCKGESDAASSADRCYCRDR